MSSTLPVTAETEQPILLNSSKNNLSPSPFPAFRERKTRFRAPRSTIQVATDLPRPPSPPVKRYEASISRASDFACEVLGSVETTSGILTTAYTLWYPFGRCRKLCSISEASNTVMQRMGPMQPREYISIHLLITLFIMISTSFDLERAFESHLPTDSGLLLMLWARSTQQYDRFARKGSKSSLPNPTRSRLPSSTSLPNSATHLHDACNNSPDSEFRTRSTPRPPVSRITSSKKESSRDLKIRLLGIPKLSRRYLTFSSLPTVV